jgi:hypothetical protein
MLAVDEGQVSEWNSRVVPVTPRASVCDRDACFDLAVRACSPPADPRHEVVLAGRRGR